MKVIFEGDMSRTGPHPLPLHLGIAMAQHCSDDPPLLRHALSQKEIVSIVKGIQMYQQYPKQRRGMQRHVLLREDQCKVYCAKPYAAMRKMKGVPLLLIPSLINKVDIFDLSKERSLMRWLTEQGVPCYLLDWGSFDKKPLHTIDLEYITKNLLFEIIQKVSKIVDRPIDVLGYCMGGTLLMRGYAHIIDHVRRIILLAAPWDFHADSMVLTEQVRLWAPAVNPVMQQKDYLPSRWIQALFASLEVEGSARKFIRFSELDQTSAEAKLFVDVEDWLNDGVDLPRPLAQQCINEWFINNALINKTICIDNESATQINAGKEILIIASDRDRLVPYTSSIVIQKDISCMSIQILKAHCGHIGFIAGKDSISDIWTPLLQFLKK